MIFQQASNHIYFVGIFRRAKCCIGLPYSEIYLFADDAKLFRHITQDSDKTALQKSVNVLQEWTQEWFLKLNASKCMVMSFGRNVEKATLTIF